MPNRYALQQWQPCDPGTKFGTVREAQNMSMLFSSDYQKLNQQLHREQPQWGTTGHKWVGVVQTLMKNYASKDLLDYGCGKQSLNVALGGGVRGYDPGIADLSATPPPADIVVCTDVLEHIEPDCLEAVLDDIHRVTRRAVLLVIATRPAIHHLPDGRNAHLLQMPIGWWRKRVQSRFQVVYEHNLRDLECVFLGEPLAR